MAPEAVGPSPTTPPILHQAHSHNGIGCMLFRNNMHQAIKTRALVGPGWSSWMWRCPISPGPAGETGSGSRRLPANITTSLRRPFLCQWSYLATRFRPRSADILSRCIPRNRESTCHLQTCSLVGTMHDSFAYPPSVKQSHRGLFHSAVVLPTPSQSKALLNHPPPRRDKRCKGNVPVWPVVRSRTLKPVHAFARLHFCGHQFRQYRSGTRLRYPL